MAKYCIITFILWLVGGWCGLHHFYLGRDRHGFLWATTWGGFLIGWLKEFTSLNRYTEEANNGYPKRLARRPAMCSELHRIFGMFIFGCFYRMVFTNAIPSTVEECKYCILAMAPIGVTFGTYLVANVGHTSCSLKYPLIGAYIGEVCFGEGHLLIDESNVALVTILSSVFCLIGWKERQRNANTSMVKRFFIWAGLGLLIISLWGSYGYYNAEVYVEELGGNVKLRHVFKVFLASQEWAAMKMLMKEIFWELWDSGWDFSKVHLRFTEGVAESQLRHASKVMEFQELEKITEKELKVRYKKLAKGWHPDKHQDNKEYAQEKFMEIQEAYELLERHIKKKYTSTTL